jgi:hypothetical protein
MFGHILGHYWATLFHASLNRGNFLHSFLFKKHGFGLHFWAIFCTNSSGRPEENLRMCLQCAMQGCQMLYFETKNPNLGKIWRVLQWKMMVHFNGHLAYFTSIWYIFWPFGIFFPFWYVVPRKIWQPWCDAAARKPRFIFSQTILLSQLLVGPSLPSEM